ncbi:glycine--tRNA ligase [Mucisphaera calidilacus]|uniref:glycine--tRNA ligase n=1 Tax=Mucisphaera calidilacus TaxID=2527982 RepID=A0A518BTF9_9BACT|nr:glycine--tRNA ligase [Mucisphaera calidilacus]QDU70245.1 Glycine--tRNA ligase [Mucisphaera calidilacus]
MTDTATAPHVTPEEKSMEDIVALCKRRGFVYPASDIYGGINGFWDYGPLGTALKNNIRDWWWKQTVECPPIGPDGEPLSVVGLDSAIIQNPKTWEASGHVGGFNDPMVDCTETKKRYRADHVEVLIVEGRGMWAFMENQPDTIAKKLKKAKIAIDDGERKLLTELDVAVYPNIIGPDTDKPGTLTEPRQFNLMFETFVGAIRNDDAKAYLRPETAQGIFLNYKNVVDTMRVKVPFGIAQVGKSFRNEVTPRNFIFRSREFEQMELEWFCAPEDSPKWYDFWKHERMNWWKSLGVTDDNLRFRDHDDDELAHYSRMCVDVEYKYPFSAPSFGELEGVAHRGCFDLTQHQEHSGTKMEYFDQANPDKDKQRYIPNVIEPASGLTRGVLVLLCEAYTPDESRAAKVFMKFKPKFAPIKAGIFPLVNKEGMPEIAHKLYLDLRQKHTVQMDAKQSIGKRYARMDEAGTPFCFTIDGETANDQAVTVRHRDTQAQERVPLDKVTAFLDEQLAD